MMRMILKGFLGLGGPGVFDKATKCKSRLLSPSIHNIHNILPLHSESKIKLNIH
jgi:hypothetical protein